MTDDFLTEAQLDIALRATQAYKDNIDAPIELREARFLQALYPGCLLSLREDDLFAGRIGPMHGNDLPVDFNPQKSSQIAYSVSMPVLRRLQTLFPHRADEIEAMIAFWKKETTFVKIREQAPDNVRAYLFPPGTGLDEEDYLRASTHKRPRGSGFISGSFDCRAAGLMPDYAKLVRLGLPGLRAELDRYEPLNPDCALFYETGRLMLDLAAQCMERYRVEALALAETAEKADKRAWHRETARILEDLQHRAPETLREGIQLVALFVILMRTENHGRMDVTLGDLLARDLAENRIDREEAVRLIMSLWDVFSENGQVYDTRVLIGGRGRDNEAAADEFALLAMEAVRRRHEVMPVLTLRLYKDQNPALLDKALELIGEGCIYPTLYNDDAYIPALAHSMRMPEEDAALYAPLGCGEMTLDHRSVGSPNSTMRFLKALEVTLHNGHDGGDGVLIGIETGDPASFETFENLYDALCRQIRAAFERDVQVHLWNRKVTQREACFILQSLLLDDCIARGKDMFHGGIRYFGANVEGFGLTNTVDSLTVIKKEVYDDKTMTLPQLIHILDVNFEGYETERARFLNAPKFGTGDAEADALKRRLEEFINDTAREIGIQAGLDYYTVANVNPGGITIGPRVSASADGRKRGTPMALGNSPMPGADTNGLTAMLLSSARSDARNGGYVTNMNLSREMITANRAQIKAAFEAYFALGGQQLNVNCFSRGDLERALVHPEQYRSLIVRVSGYSARFVDLDPITQKHILERTLY